MQHPDKKNMAPKEKREKETEKIQWDQDRFVFTRRVAPGEREEDLQTWVLPIWRLSKKEGGWC